MKQRIFLTLGVLVSLFFITNTSSVLASGLKISPLIYRDSLQKNEKQKGHIDISNTSDSEVVVKAEVNGFKQIDQEGTLEFFEEPKYVSGITFDHDSFTLGPREALRLYFLLDANTLPSGGVYAALFFNIEPNEVTPGQTSLQPITRVGSLLIIDNGGDGKAKASITDLNASFFQFGSGLRANVAVSNKKGDGVIAGFPRIATSVFPFGGSKKDSEGSMVMPGATRKFEVKHEGTFIGLTRLSVSNDSSAKQKWVFAVTGKAIWVIVFGVLLFIVGIALFRKNRNGKKAT